jgi:hypothetical protein
MGLASPRKLPDVRLRELVGEILRPRRLRKRTREFLASSSRLISTSQQLCLACLPLDEKPPSQLCLVTAHDGANLISVVAPRGLRRRHGTCPFQSRPRAEIAVLTLPLPLPLPLPVARPRGTL